jgi:hypothetical protein
MVVASSASHHAPSMKDCWRSREGSFRISMAYLVG